MSYREKNTFETYVSPSCRVITIQQPVPLCGSDPVPFSRNNDTDDFTRDNDFSW